MKYSNSKRYLPLFREENASGGDRDALVRG